MRNPIFLIAFASIGILGTVPLMKSSTSVSDTTKSSDDKLPNVEVKKPEKKTIYRKLTQPGTFVANQQATLYARVSGYVKEVKVDIGKEVKENDVLAEIEVPELQKQVERDKAELDLCGPMVDRAKAERDWRKAQYERADELIKKSKNLITQDAVDELKGKYNISEADLKVTDARTASLKAAHEKSLEMVKFATIRAPFNGIISARFVDKGDLTQPGLTKMFHIVQTNPVRCVVFVSEPDTRWVQDGKLVVLAIGGMSDGKFASPDGKPTSVSRYSKALNENTKSMRVEIDVKNEDGSIRPGMFANVTVDLQPHPDALTVPAGALIVEKKKAFLFVVKGGIATKTQVIVKLDNGIELEVEGISEQDDVIVSGKNMVSDGERVRVSTK